MSAVREDTRAGLEGLAELARVSLDGSNESIDRMLSLARAALDRAATPAGRTTSLPSTSRTGVTSGAA